MGRPRNGIYKKCKTCGKKFYVSRSQINAIYCSINCKAKSQKGIRPKIDNTGRKQSKETKKKIRESHLALGRGKIVKCVISGKEFYRVKS